MSEGTRDSMALAIGRQLVDGVMNSLSPQDLAVLARRYDLVLVPEDPTGPMCSAGMWEKSQHGLAYAEACYRAMIAAGQVKPE